MPRQDQALQQILASTPQKGSDRFAVMPAVHKQQQSLSHTDTLQPDHRPACRVENDRIFPAHAQLGSEDHM